MGFWHRVYTRIGLLDAAGRGWEVTVSKRTANIVIRTLTALTVLGLVLAAVLYNPVADGEAALFVFSDGGSVVADSGRVFDVALMILRAALGMMIFVHGYNKAFRGGQDRRHRPLVPVDGDASRQGSRRTGRLHRDGRGRAARGLG